MSRNVYGKTRTVPHKRKRKRVTDYKRRLNLLKSGKLRLVVRRTMKNIVVQVVQYGEDGDKILASATAQELKKFGWKGYLSNLPSAYLTGLLAGKKALKQKLKDAVLDTGLETSVRGTKIYAALKGVVDSGLNVPYSDAVIPPEDRINGNHISAYATKLKEDKEKYDLQFAKYIKSGYDPQNIAKDFEVVKDKILNS